jgi:hypothetical protein
MLPGEDKSFTVFTFNNINMALTHNPNAYEFRVHENGLTVYADNDLSTLPLGHIPNDSTYKLIGHLENAGQVKSSNMVFTVVANSGHSSVLSSVSSVQGIDGNGEPNKAQRDFLDQLIRDFESITATNVKIHNNY